MRIAIHKTAALVTSMACISGSCSSVPKLLPHVARLELREQIQKASLVVVGIVEDERAVVRVAAESKEELIPLELRAVRIRVEGVLEGRFDGKELTFYYYQATGAWDGSPINILSPQERDIFFLVKDGGVLRAPADVYLSHTRVLTGKHHVSRVVSKDLVPTAIARLLLVPGDEAEVQKDLALWRRSLAVALSLVPQAQVVQILQNDLESSNSEVRGRVCLLLADFPLKEKGCLLSVVNDRRVPQEDRKRAQELMDQD